MDTVPMSRPRFGIKNFIVGLDGSTRVCKGTLRVVRYHRNSCQFVEQLLELSSFNLLHLVSKRDSRIVWGVEFS